METERQCNFEQSFFRSMLNLEGPLRSTLFACPITVGDTWVGAVPPGRIIVHAAVPHIHACDDAIAQWSAALDQPPAHDRYVVIRHTGFHGRVAARRPIAHCVRSFISDVTIRVGIEPWLDCDCRLTDEYGNSSRARKRTDIASLVHTGPVRLDRSRSVSSPAANERKAQAVSIGTVHNSALVRGLSSKQFFIVASKEPIARSITCIDPIEKEFIEFA